MGPRHHYIPQFYLKAWTAADGRLCEYSQPFDRVKAQRVSPKATAFVRGLYTIADVPAEAADAVERRFLLIADQRASCALELLLSGKSLETMPWTADTRSGWSRFIISLIQRNPEAVARFNIKAEEALQDALNDFKANYQKHRKSTDPETFGEYAQKIGPNPVGRACALLLARVIDSENVGGHINQMRWSVLHFRSPRFPLLTSDRPVIKTSGIMKADAHIIIPISPTAIFTATNTVQAENELRRLNHDRLLGWVNDQMSLQARKYVYGQDDKQLRFVANRFGRVAKDSAELVPVMKHAGPHPGRACRTPGLTPARVGSSGAPAAADRRHDPQDQRSVEDSGRPFGAAVSAGKRGLVDRFHKTNRIEAIE
jgi:hypothetical protein